MVMGLINAARDMVTIKRLLTQAEAEARQVGEEVPGPEHLLLAATTLPDGTASQALQRVGVSAAGLRTAINEVHAQALAGAGIEVDDAPDDTAELRGPLTRVFRATLRPSGSSDRPPRCRSRRSRHCCRVLMSSQRAVTWSVAPSSAR
jgi:ATP-dependent Clp protease ATP-binding subunit ClpA